MMTNLPGRFPGIIWAAVRPGAPRRAVRAAALGGVTALAAVIVLAACGAGAETHSAPGPAPTRQGLPAPAAPVFRAAAGASGHQRSAAPASVLLASQSIIYTASLTERVTDLQQAVARATGIAAAAGGYTASEQMSAQPGTSVISNADLQLEIPVAGYQSAFASLSGLGARVSVSQDARNVTQQVADVASRVASAQAAISQLRALLAHAGSVGALLSVQDQINSEESALESLLAQQRALAHQTSYATVSLQLLPPLHKAAVRHKHRRHGFAAGLASGWRALRTVTTTLLAAIGAALPFAAVLAVLAALLLAGQRRFRRRGPGPGPAPEA